MTKIPANSHANYALTKR